MTPVTPQTDRRLEMIAVLIMSLTAICTAWTGFQSSKWSGVMTIRFSEANAARTLSVAETADAKERRQVDVMLGLAWIEALSADDTERANFLAQRFGEPLQTAIDDWLETAPLTNPNAPRTPFEMPSYVIDSETKAAELLADADTQSQLARDANQNSDNYVFLTIVFASVIFFAALSTKLEHFRSRSALLALATVGLIAGLVVLSTFPIEV